MTAARLVAWIRLRPLPQARLSSLRLSWAGTNAVAVTQRQSAGRQQIGRGTGLSGQELSVGATNVELGSLVIEVEEEEGMRAWPLVPDIVMAGRGERACQVDAEAGTVRFGDGVRGAVPASGRAIHVAYMRSGGGTAGNLPAGSLKAITGLLPAPRLKLNQPLAMAGGVDPETLDLAEARIPAELRHGDRAVTRNDFKALAAATPGVSIARVEVLERFKPQQRREPLPGVVSVMAIPARAGTEKPAPRPDRAMLETVHAWLDARRPLGTELYVIAPEYVPVGVSAAVELVDPSTARRGARRGVADDPAALVAARSRRPRRAGLAARPRARRPADRDRDRARARGSQRRAGAPVHPRLPPCVAAGARGRHRARADPARELATARAGDAFGRDRLERLVEPAAGGRW